MDRTSSDVGPGARRAQDLRRLWRDAHLHQRQHLAVAGPLHRSRRHSSIQETGSCFTPRADKRVVIAPSAWSKCVKATFARHGDVALCPKDARASFITFLRGGDHDDETVKDAAIAMRHSSKIQASATYDKGGSDPP